MVAGDMTGVQAPLSPHLPTQDAVQLSAKRRAQKPSPFPPPHPFPLPLEFSSAPGLRPHSLPTTAAPEPLCPSLSPHTESSGRNRSPLC